MFAILKYLRSVLGEVQTTPTTNTLLYRLKQLEIIIGEVQASPTENTLLERTKVLETELIAIKGYVDGIEGLLNGGLPAALDNDRLKVSVVAESHDMGGTEHDADTLANVNTKVSDATLLASTAIQFKTGALHTAAEHHSGGALALTLKSIDATACKIKTGTYTGDGTEDQAIAGIGFQPISVKIWDEQADNVEIEIHEKIDAFADMGATFSVRWTKGNSDEWRIEDEYIISLDADGFSVDDNTIDSHPNKDGQVYYYICLG